MDQLLEEEGTVRVMAVKDLQHLKEFSSESYQLQKNGRRVPFDREKLAKSLFTALKKDQLTQTL